ncbi:hypothetical protein HZZ13_00155 [Bradyrhizobium sp. CNPSo 4010]|uniref:Uncharacterized protein n=1 Tax=Bradyrhizobium agreste TaxID=2751811 RepID=A0ABS0PGC9_9BRAD|nr:hypothetical protein [Bradyrhizobium agreste]MBH5396247.1 hypothetical protein [Bradyrhizobium agreste]
MSKMTLLTALPGLRTNNLKGLSATLTNQTLIHRLNPKAADVFLTHTPDASELTPLKDLIFQAIGQTEIGFINQIAYHEH